MIYAVSPVKSERMTDATELIVGRILLLGFCFVFESQFGLVVLIFLIGFEVILGVFSTFK